MAGIANIVGFSNIINKAGKTVDIETYCRGKIIGFYFSGHWCGPCREFTPILVKFYNDYSESKNFEIIFVSSDRDEDGFNVYYGKMPWLALDWTDRRKKEYLAHMYGVSSIPTLVLVDADSGTTLTTKAREKIQYNDRKGRQFPWTESANGKRRRLKDCQIL